MDQIGRSLVHNCAHFCAHCSQHSFWVTGSHVISHCWCSGMLPHQWNTGFQFLRVFFAHRSKLVLHDRWISWVLGQQHLRSKFRVWASFRPLKPSWSGTCQRCSQVLFRIMCGELLFSYHDAVHEHDDLWLRLVLLMHSIYSIALTGIWVMVDVVANHMGPIQHDDVSGFTPFNKRRYYHNCTGYSDPETVQRHHISPQNMWIIMLRHTFVQSLMYWVVLEELVLFSYNAQDVYNIEMISIVVESLTPIHFIQVVGSIAE